MVPCLHLMAMESAPLLLAKLLSSAELIKSKRKLAVTKMEKNAGQGKDAVLKIKTCLVKLGPINVQPNVPNGENLAKNAAMASNARTASATYLN